jgi:hypothetical protein
VTRTPSFHTTSSAPHTGVRATKDRQKRAEGK